jgi:predicted nucleotidyltransferase
MRALESEGYRPTVPVPASQFADASLRQSWIRDKGIIVFQLHSDRHPETRVDLFVEEPFDFDHEYDQALIGELLPGLQTRFVGLETLIHMKEAAGREKDREDIRQLRLLQQDISDE